MRREKSGKGYRRKIKHQENAAAIQLPDNLGILIEQELMLVQPQCMVVKHKDRIPFVLEINGQMSLPYNLSQPMSQLDARNLNLVAVLHGLVSTC